jgi:toxin-antitoxin system PIN domain toxin
VISVDTNVLLHGLDSDSDHHPAARELLTRHQRDSGMVLCELVLVELYVLLRNPAVVRRPLTAGRAVEVIDVFRHHPHWQLIDHDRDVMDQVWKAAGDEGLARTRIFDVRLGLTLRRHGVTEFATRNVKHFEGLGFERVFDPERVVG